MKKFFFIIFILLFFTTAFANANSNVPNAVNYTAPENNSSYPYKLHYVLQFSLDYPLGLSQIINRAAKTSRRFEFPDKIYCSTDVTALEHRLFAQTCGRFGDHEKVLDYPSIYRAAAGALSIVILLGATAAIWALFRKWSSRTAAKREGANCVLGEGEDAEKYRNIAERANDGVLIVQKGVIKYCNPQLAAMMKRAVEEMSGEPFDKFLAPEEREKVRARYERRLRGEDVPSRYESAVLHQDGRTITDVEINASIMDFEGRPATLAFIRDITARKEADHIIYETLEQFSALNDELIDTQRELVKRNAELQEANEALQNEIAAREHMGAALRESAARYRSLFEDSPIALREEDFSAVKIYLDNLRAAGVTDFNAYLTAHPEMVKHCMSLIKTRDVNEAAVELYEAESKEQLVQNLHLTLSENYFCALRDLLVALANGNLIFECELTIYTLRSKQIYLITRSFVAPDYADTFERVLIAMIDVTERKRIEEALRQSEANLVKAQEIAHFGSWDWNFATNQLVWSNETYRIFGLEPRSIDLTLEGVRERIHPEDREGSFALIDAAIKEGEAAMFEQRIFRPDGEMRYLLGHSEAVYGTGGNPLRVIGTLQDITDRKLAEEELRNSQEQLALIADGVPALIAYVSAELRYLYVNEAYAKWYGRTKEELTGKLIRDTLAEDAYLRALPAYQKVLAGQKVSFENVVKRYGEERVVAVNLVPHFHDDGAVKAFFGMIHDITERNRAEQTVQRANAKLKQRIKELSALNTIFQTISTMTDMPSTLQAVTRTITELFNTNGCGITLLNEARTELRLVAEYSIHPDQPNAVGFSFSLDNNPADARVIETGKTIVITPDRADLLAENAHKLMEERRGTCQLITPLLTRGQAFGTITMGSDQPGRVFTPEEITLIETIAGQIAGGIENLRLFAKEQRQRQVAESLREVALALNSSLDLKTVLDRILEQVERVIRYDSAGIFLHDDDALVLSGGAKIVEKFFGSRILIESDDPVAQVFKHRRVKIIDDVHASPNWQQWEDEEPIHAWMGAPLLVGERAVGVLTIDSFNIAEYSETDAQHLQTFANQAAVAIENARLFEDAQQAREEAERANRAKSVFLANTSHELRTPLNAILGFAQIMARSPDIPPEHQDSLDTILRSGEHLLGLINQVLDLSKIEAGRATVNEKNFDLHAMLDSLEDMFHLRAVTKDLRLTFDRAANVPRYICTDEVKLRQILINLLNNALKFTETGGIDLRVRSKRQAAGCRLSFAVEDTGLGISAEEQENIFEAFIQTEAGKKIQEGTGLGLPISRRFAELLGGEMSVESEVGRGSKFEFDIQVRAIEAAAVAVPTTESPRRVLALAAGQPTYRVLVVDDKWDNRQPLVRLLSPLGFEIKEANDGASAVEICDSWQPHLIWMDIRMPVMNGYEATERIQAMYGDDRAAASPIIIALTAHAFEEERMRALSAGFDDFLSKPFKEAEVFELMSAHLGVRYIYAEQYQPYTAPQAASAPRDILTPAALAALPEDLLGDLERATVRSRLDEIFALIERVRGYDAALATALKDLADDFEYGKILEAIRINHKGHEEH